ARLRRVGCDHRADPVSRAVASLDSAVHLRVRRASAVGGVGGLALSRDPPGRGARRGAERDGQRAAVASVARDLRAACRRGDLRAARGARRPAAAGSGPCDLGVLRGARRARAVGKRRGAAGRSRARTRTASARGRAALTDPLLRARGVARRFGAQVALEPTDIDVRAGESLALIGPNGAGKSTLLAILADVLEPCEGRVERVGGVRVGWVPQRPALYDRLTARENLELFARLEGAKSAAGAAERLLTRFDVPADRPAHTLSVGNRQRLNVAL